MKELNQVEIHAVSGAGDLGIEAGPIVIEAIVAIAKELIRQLETKNPGKNPTASILSE